MPKIEKKQKADVAIPTGSMGDIVFLLLIFFMVTTVFVEYRGISGIQQPRAETTERLENRRDITHMWISQRGELMVDDNRLEVEQVAAIVYNKRVENPEIVVSIVADVDAPYGMVSEAMKQLRQADALRVNFATLYAR
jgi:biopolymer transport protein ExbD